MLEKSGISLQINEFLGGNFLFFSFSDFFGGKN
jgi:hypothetical protein